MGLVKQERLYGWGHASLADCSSARPEKHRDLQHILSAYGNKLIARGLGRAYGDAALQPEGVVRMERMDHIISFDGQQGILRAQAGVTLSDLMALCIPKGWMIPVLPGTRHVTLGGAFACNVHGKNHFKDGDFAEHVIAIRLLNAHGQSIECSPEQNAELFWATAGGMGMTGIIEEVALRLKPIASASLETVSYRIDSLDDMISAFEQHRASSDYMVGWIDHMANGDELGRGVFEAAVHTDNGMPCREYAPRTSRLGVPFFLPSFLLNRYSMALYNWRRFGRYTGERKTAVVNFDGFFHPLDNIEHWNRLYGKRGFFQYQFVLPESAQLADELHALLSMLQERKLFSYLAVLKYHRAGKGLITFPIQGYSLALDFPNTARVRAMLPSLDEWVAQRRGRIYLAKDALLSPQMFHAMYGESGARWQSIIRDIDPEKRFMSLMSERLQWK